MYLVLLPEEWYGRLLRVNTQACYWYQHCQILKYSYIAALSEFLNENK